MRLHYLRAIGFALIAACLAPVLTGCASSRTSHTARTAREQLLLSNAVDQSLDKLCLAPLRRRAVFVSDEYLDCVDKAYVMGTIRHRLLANDSRLVASAEEADVVLEVRSGGIGTNQSEGFIGIPAFGLPGMPLDLPEVKLITQETQSGLVKLAFVAYDAKTGIALGQGGTSIARANEDNWYVLGVGPFLEGSISDEVRHATGSNDSLPSPYELIADSEAEPCPQFISLVDEERRSVPRIASETSDSLAR
jgi:hypothetical protein